jgi:hypothetical protein
MGKNAPSDAEYDTFQLGCPNSPDKHVIPRRFPRVGSQFQTRIAKWSDPLDRPPPDRMSVEYPYATEIEVFSSGSSDVANVKKGYGRFIVHLIALSLFGGRLLSSRMVFCHKVEEV